jgi:hypothetical protein
VQAHDAVQRAAHLQPHLRRREQADGREARASSRTCSTAACAPPPQAKRASSGFEEKLTLSLADKLVFGEDPRAFGGRLKYAFSGGAALSGRGRVHRRARHHRLRGLRPHRDLPIATANFPGAAPHRQRRQGHPRRAITSTTSSTGDEKHGEIVVYGPNVMKGYHNRDEENKAVFMGDGGFRTGDLGYLDDEGFLYITGRIKEQYKLENGKYVAPAPLEESSSSRRSSPTRWSTATTSLYNVALVVPDIPRSRAWAERAGHHVGSTDDKLLRQPEGESRLVMAEVEKYSGTFKGFERVKKIALVAPRTSPPRTACSRRAQAEAPRRLAEVRREDRAALRRWAPSIPSSAATPPRAFTSAISRALRTFTSLPRLRATLPSSSSICCSMTCARPRVPGTSGSETSPKNCAPMPPSTRRGTST